LSIMIISSINSNFVLAGLEHTSRTLLFMLIVYSIYSLIDGEKRIKLILISLIFCSAIYFLFFIFKLFELNFNLAELYGYLFNEEGAEYIGKNYLGVFFSLVIIILTSLSFSNEFNNKRGFIYFIIAVLFFSLVLTNSRASIFCLLISVSAIFYMLNRKLFYLGFLSLAALSIIIFLTPLGSDILLYLRVEDLGTGREYLINSAIEVIKENYLFGVGPGGTKYELYSSMPYMANTPQEWLILKNIRVGEIGQAHNFYLFYFTDLGICGFILSLIFPIIFFNLTYKLMRKLKSKSSSKYFLVVGIYCTGIFMFIRGIFEPQNLLSFGGISADLPFWLLISIICYYYSKHFTKLKPGAIQ